MPTCYYLTFMYCQPCLPNFQCFESCVSWTRFCIFFCYFSYAVATSGPTIWTRTYGLEPGLYNRLLIELSGWGQTVHMFTQRFTYHVTQYSRRSLNAFAFFFSFFCACIYDLAEPCLRFSFFVGSAVSELSSGWSINCFLRYVCCCIIVKDKSQSVLMVDKCCRFASWKTVQNSRQ